MTAQDEELAGHKREVRRRVAGRLRRLPPDQRVLLDRKICERAASLDPLRRADCVMAYCPLPDEVQLLPLLGVLFGSGIRVGMPRVLLQAGAMCVHEVRCIQSDCRPGTMAIPEPRTELPTIEPDAIGLVLVPGRVFTLRGERVGRGGGFYDRFLRSTPAALRVALCYEEQIEPRVPTAEHDECVDILVTPERIVWTRARPEPLPAT